jgi:hypothetical protein
MFRKPKDACFLSYVEYRPNTNISNYIHNIYPKVGQLEETKGGGKERKIERILKYIISV